MVYLIDKSAIVAEIEKAIDEPAPSHDQQCPWEDGYYCGLYKANNIIDTIETKEVDFERELSKYISNGIHRFFPNVDDDYCKMESFIWQDYVIETARYFFELGLKTRKGGRE